MYINQDQYRDKIDIWSVGCIMAELILLRPVFPGTDHIDHLHKIFEVIGTPDTATLNEICTVGLFRNSDDRLDLQEFIVI